MLFLNQWIIVCSISLIHNWVNSQIPCLIYGSICCLICCSNTFTCRHMWPFLLILWILLHRFEFNNSYLCDSLTYCLVNTINYCMSKRNKVRYIPTVNRTFWLGIVLDHCAVHTCANDIITNCGLVMRSNSLTNGWQMYHVMDTM